MFKNLKIIMKMGSLIAAVHPLHLDSILSAAKAKELLGEEYYSGENIVGTKEMIDEMLSSILDKKYGVYCASCGIGEYREFVGSWSKRWDSKNDDIVNFEGKTERIDIGAGHYKNYHMPLILKSYKEIIFYARGDKKEIERLLNTYIHYIGKKASQGYGKIRDIVIEEIEKDYSIIKNDKLMRPVPVKYAGDIIEALIRNQKHIYKNKYPEYPPYWRTDNLVDCIMPE